MIVYLLRHGIAADYAPGRFASDADRPLTDEGWEKMRQEAAGMRALGLELDAIFTSPLRRARETAQTVAEAYGMEDQMTVLETLAPGHGLSSRFDQHAPIFVELGAQKFERAVLVGHQPDMGELASALLAGFRGLNIDFKKGALCAIDVERLAPDPGNALLWFLAPRHLRMLGKL